MSLEFRNRTLREIQSRLAGFAGVRVFSLSGEPPYRFIAMPGWGPGTGAAESPLGASLADLVAADDFEQTARCIAEALAHPGTLCESEFRLARSVIPRVAWVRVHALGAELAGKPVVHCTLLPIDRQKQAEALAEERRVEFERSVLRMTETQRFLEGLQHTTELVHLSEREADGYRVVVDAGRALLPNWEGTVTAAGGESEMQIVAHWGGEPGAELPEAHGEQADCWALRLGRLHHVSAAGAKGGKVPVCAHFGHEGALPPGVTHAICVPFQVAEGRTGALHLLARVPISGGDLREALWRAQSFADTLRLSLSNLHMRVSLREQAQRDGMTGLFNRRYFDDALAREISRAGREQGALALAMFDIDHFKSFNDTFGHDAGDEVIRLVARQLLGFVRSYDIACRIGGEELALLMPGARVPDACVRLNGLREQISALRIETNGVALPPITVSVGVASLDGGSAGDLVRRADLALYASKNAGRNRLTYWSRELEALERRRDVLGRRSGRRRSAPDKCPASGAEAAGTGSGTVPDRGAAATGESHTAAHV